MKYFLLFLFLYFSQSVSGVFYKDNSIDYYLSNHKVHFKPYNSQNVDDWFKDFDPQCDTIFLIHGWLPFTYFYAKEQFRGTVNNYMKIPQSEGCYNVICVTWSASNSSSYFKSAYSAIGVGEAVGDFAINLHRRSLVPRRMDCTGESLGAHVCGTAGRKAKWVRPFEVVTGLDPAGPSFTSALSAQDLSAYRLYIGDGTLVVTIMTNGGFAGTSTYLGDVNFVANDGTKQPGCTIVLPNCSHFRALMLDEEAVSHPYFIGHDDRGRSVIFGRYMPLIVPRGVFQFKTNTWSPYGPSS